MTTTTSGSAPAPSTPDPAVQPDTVLADGMRLVPLPTFPDDRGRLTEVFRQSWDPGLRPMQWNLVRSEGGVMRGMHVHLCLTEWYVLVQGTLLVGWRDVRQGSPTQELVGVTTLDAQQPSALASPTGICHGLFAPGPAVLLIGTTAEWDPANELGCHWQDPELEIPWPTMQARVSARDEAQPSLASLRALVPPYRPAT